MIKWKYDKVGFANRLKMKDQMERKNKNFKSKKDKAKHGLRRRVKISHFFGIEARVYGGEEKKRKRRRKNEEEKKKKEKGRREEEEI